MLKKDLRRLRDGKTDTRISGTFDISFGRSVKATMGYYLEDGGEFDYLVIHKGSNEQRIKLANGELHYGPTTWLVCDCGKRVSKLYIVEHGSGFKCRQCLKLRYESSTFNRRSFHGNRFYKMSRQIRLIAIRESIPRILRLRGFTKRFWWFLELCAKVGKWDEIVEAQQLLIYVGGRASELQRIQGILDKVYTQPPT
jgi:hypothetical protein